jgi:hypothetical protein
LYDALAHTAPDASHDAAQAADHGQPVLDAELTAEILSADRRGPEALEGLLACLSEAERHAAMALLQQTHGNSHVAKTVGARDSFLSRALAKHAGDGAAVTPAAAETIVRAEHAGLGEKEATQVAREVQSEEVARAQPETTAAPAPDAGSSERDVYLANKASMDARWERETLFQRALARHRGEQVEPPLPDQTVEAAPTAPAEAAKADQAAAQGPVVTEKVTAPPEQAAPVPVSTAPAPLTTTFQAAQAAPVSTTKEGIDSLNTEGSYDYRLGKVAQIRNDMQTGSQDYISPDVSPEVIEQTRPHLGEGGITDEQMVAIQGYSSQDYLAVNKALRQPDADPARTAQLAGYINAVRSGLDNLPSYEGEVFRGTAMSQRIWGMWERAHAEGTTVSDAAFSSSSKDEGVAEDFLASTRDPSKVPVYCRIQSRTGKQIEFLSRTANEAEVLFNAGAQFKIIYIEDTVGPDGLPRKEVFLREVAEQHDGG